MVDVLHIILRGVQWQPCMCVRGTKRKLCFRFTWVWGCSRDNGYLMWNLGLAVKIRSGIPLLHEAIVSSMPTSEEPDVKFCLVPLRGTCLGLMVKRSRTKHQNMSWKIQNYSFYRCFGVMHFNYHPCENEAWNLEELKSRLIMRDDLAVSSISTPVLNKFGNLCHDSRLWSQHFGIATLMRRGHSLKTRVYNSISRSKTE